jgi:hypothetical protein
MIVSAPLWKCPQSLRAEAAVCDYYLNKQLRSRALRGTSCRG